MSSTNYPEDDEVEHIYLGEEEHKQHEQQSEQGHHHLHKSVETAEEYKKFRRLLIGILIVSSLLTTIRGWELNRFMGDFMAIFFITFSAFKFTDIEGFAIAYRGYDVLAKRIRPWAYIVPFIEAFLGFWYLLSAGPTNLIVITLLFTGTAGIGVYQELKRGSKVQCACLGTFIRLPLTRISLVEDATMFVMAALMLIF